MIYIKPKEILSSIDIKNIKNIYTTISDYKFHIVYTIEPWGKLKFPKDVFTSTYNPTKFKTSTNKSRKELADIDYYLTYIYCIKNLLKDKKIDIINSIDSINIENKLNKIDKFINKELIPIAISGINSLYNQCKKQYPEIELSNHDYISIN